MRWLINISIEALEISSLGVVYLLQLTTLWYKFDESKTWYQRFNTHFNNILIDWYLEQITSPNYRNCNTSLTPHPKYWYQYENFLFELDSMKNGVLRSNLWLLGCVWGMRNLRKPWGMVLLKFPIFYTNTRNFETMFSI